MTLLQNQCELERTQMLTIVMLATQNTRFAGYMLTGNRSMFLDTDGSVAWLYQCPEFLSPLRVLVLSSHSFTSIGITCHNLLTDYT